MKQFIVLFILLFITNSYCEAQRKFTTLLSFEVNKSMYDRTITNNSEGIGFELQGYLNTKGLIKPMLEVNADLFAGTKELYATAGGKIIYPKDEVTGIYAGPSIITGKGLFFGVTIGRSFYNNESYFGIRPSVGTYISKSKRWATKLSFTNIFQRDEISHESFGYLSFALALRVF